MSEDNTIMSEEDQEYEEFLRMLYDDWEGDNKSWGDILTVIKFKQRKLFSFKPFNIYECDGCSYKNEYDENRGTYGINVYDCEWKGLGVQLLEYESENAYACPMCRTLLVVDDEEDEDE